MSKKRIVTDEQCEIAVKIYSEYKTEITRRMDFTKGLALGLIYGIIGNLFVQFFYPVVEAIVSGKFDMLFVTNSIVSAVSLSMLLIITWKFSRELLRLEKWLRKIKWTIKVLNGEIEPTKTPEK
jgi:phosphotransferase system  glucose/maltose/N-acetylglucosamine-specific IIC component